MTAIEPNHEPSGFEIVVVPERGRAAVVLHGELDLRSASLVRGRMEAVFADGLPEVVLDLRELTFMDASGIHLLVDLQAAAAARGMDFAIRLPSEGPARRLLRLTRLEDRFTLA